MTLQRLISTAIFDRVSWGARVTGFPGRARPVRGHVSRSCSRTRARPPISPNRPWLSCEHAPCHTSTTSSAPTAAIARPASSATQGFRRETRGCEKCGFAYLFELLDDYYPAPNAAFFACDREGRIVDCGRGSFELTGIRTEQAIGRPVREVLGLDFEDGSDHSAPRWNGRSASRASRSRSTPSTTCPRARWPTSFPPTMTRKAGCFSCSRQPIITSIHLSR